jgi:hypothetical protein
MINGVSTSMANPTANPLPKNSHFREPRESKHCTNGQCTVELGNTSPNTGTYSRPEISSSPNNEEMSRLKKAADEALMPLRMLVEELLRKQGLTFLDGTGNILDGEMVPIDEETRLEAQRLISEGGEFSIENTSQRIFHFAVALSGGDPSKVDALKEFVTAGFKEAEKIFGGNLPQISHQTYQRTLEKLDAWSVRE